MKYLFLTAFCASSLLVASAQTEAIYMPETPLTIMTEDAEHSITVEVVDDPEETATGLMFRDGIAADRGMIFDFGQPREANMWMRNVPFPIDMVFMDTDGSVLATVSHVQANSERRINPGFAVKGVLELADGQVSEFGIKPGDMIVHDIFDSAPALAQNPDADADEAETEESEN